MVTRLDTLLAQAGTRHDQITGALVAPLHFSTTYQHPEFGHSTGYDYTRTKNPTRATLEETLALIESGQFALATASGMAAIVLAFDILPVGTKIVACRDLYGGSYRWFDEQQKQGRFSFSYANNEKEMLALINSTTDLVYLETPTNPMMVEFDIEKIVNKAQACGAKVFVDNTFYSPIYQKPLELGADLVIHSATKYLAGHNDVLAGAVIVRDEELYQRLLHQLNTSGAVLSPFDSYLVMRGLKTLSVRMERITYNAKKVVAMLKKHPSVQTVTYPGRGGMISFKVSDETIIPKFLNQLKVITFAESLGGVESLITYPATQTHHDIPEEVRATYGLTNDLLRLSVGIEDMRDLIEDIEQAFITD